MLAAISESKANDFYTRMVASYTGARVKELPSYNEFISIVLKKPAETEKVFDEDTDKKLEAHALKLLHQGRS